MGKPLSQPQIPTTLPTYDEVLGQEQMNQEKYNPYLLSLIAPGSLNVLTIHAEVEGISCLGLFQDFLDRLRLRGGHLVPLGELLPSTSQITGAVIERQRVEGREGWLSVQQTTGEAGEHERCVIPEKPEGGES
jgi:undecaprenyl phosphate-alpha-L-ara4FN deformylase